MIKEKKGDCIFIDIKNWIFFAACHETFQLIGISFSVSSQLWHQFSFWFYLPFFWSHWLFHLHFFKVLCIEETRPKTTFLKGGVFAQSVTKVVYKSVAKMNTTSYYLGGGAALDVLGNHFRAPSSAK